MKINETKSRQEKEQMLVDLFNYLSKEQTDDIYDGGKYGNGYINTSYKAYNYFEPKEIVHNIWAVHFTNMEGYEGITKRGFRIGVHNYDDSWILLNFNYNGEKLPIGANYNGEIGMVEFESIYTMIKFAIGK